MKTNQKLFLNTFTIKILSENEQLNNLSLEDMYYEVTDGSCVLHSMNCEIKEVNKEKMRFLLKDCGSEPIFFQL